MQEEKNLGSWPQWKKIAFRFVTIFFLLFTAPWMWFDSIPGVTKVTRFYHDFLNWLVNLFNTYIFKIREELIPIAGSGDTSFGWAEIWTYLFLALVGCVIWSIIDRKRLNYDRLGYWVRNLVRYYVAIVALLYGITKLFTLQMPFPSLSQFATNLGDFYPMRLSWMFMGYSAPYQIFSGIMEVLVGLLLFNRKTVTLGALLGFGVFANVAMMNFAYDIPVKIFSVELLLSCLFLLLWDWKRIVNFFFLNKDAPPTDFYSIQLKKKWHKIARVVWKIGFVVLFIAIPIKESWDWYQQKSNLTDVKPIKSGIYSIQTFVKNNDTLPVLYNDPFLWKDFIFDKGGRGSIKTTDTIFRQRYGRGYFGYEVDSIQKRIEITKRSWDTIPLFTMKYEISGERGLKLWTVIKNDSLYFELRRSERDFPLAAKEFNWITEAIK